MAPLTRGRAGPSRIPNDIMKTYYEQRASAGLIISEATAISEQGYGWYAAPGCYTIEQSNAWKNIVDGVHSKGGKIFLQLWHMGRQGHPSFHNNEVVSASDIAIANGHVRDANNVQAPYATPRALETAEIPQIVQDYKKSAEFAKLAGFDGVEVHGANGYLIDQFLQTASNKRTDEYGAGSFENRYRFLHEIIVAVKDVYPADRIGVRLSPNGAFGGMGSEDNDVFFPFPM
jgi:2,4-dienoyl-CoA reductase-like NADH-dependent reductase (Old Yellow Enzyme family)